MSLEHERHQKDYFFKNHPHSPLTAAQKAKFTSLEYYPVDESLNLQIEIEEFPDKPQLQMQTSTGDVRTYLKWGRFQFDVGSDTAELTIYYSPEMDHYFLPFMDATSGNETYSAGRYIDPEYLGNGQFHIDFNLAYSPYCAYNANWSCPIPPAENRLKVRIEAGEKKPSEVWAEGY
ncbi:MAG: DUF1684 domain-containing protein [Chloroflexi bacterium]|nr:DUF1684 domain-containing protein [Chloroflexota bacterium]